MNRPVEGHGIQPQLNILLLEQNKSHSNPRPKHSVRQTTPWVESKIISLRELELSWIFRLLFEVGPSYFSIPRVQGLAISHTC